MAYVTDEDLQNALEQFADDLGVTLDEVLQLLQGKLDVVNGRLSTNEADIQALYGEIKKITEVGELDSESLAEKIIAINEAIGEASDDVVKSLFDRIAENKAATAAVDAKADAIDAKVEANKSEQDTKNTELSDGIAAVDTKVADLTKVVSDNKTANENALAALTEKVDTNAKGVEDEITARQLQGKGLQDQIDELKGDGAGSLGDLEARTKVIEDTINDTTDEDGNLVKGHSTRISDLEGSTVSLQAQIDVINTPTSGVICPRKAVNKIRAVFSLELLDEDCGSSGDGETA